MVWSLHTTLCLCRDFQTVLTWHFLNMFLEEVERHRRSGDPRIDQKHSAKLAQYHSLTSEIRSRVADITLASSVPAHVSAGATTEQQPLSDIQFQKTDAAEATGYSFSGSKW